MDAAQALADLTEISSQVVEVAIIDRDGSVLATTIDDAGRADRFVQAVARLLGEAETLGQSRGLASLSQLEASTLEGSVFAVRREGRLIAATTRADPTVGLVFYDLKHCLGSVGEPSAQPPAGPERSVNGAHEQPAEPRPPRTSRKKADTSA